MQGLHGYKIRTAETTTKCVTQSEIKGTIQFTVLFLAGKKKKQCNVLSYNLDSEYYALYITVFQF